MSRGDMYMVESVFVFTDDQSSTSTSVPLEKFWPRSGLIQAGGCPSHSCNKAYLLNNIVKYLGWGHSLCMLLLPVLFVALLCRLRLILLPEASGLWALCWESSQQTRCFCKSVKMNAVFAITLSKCVKKCTLTSKCTKVHKKGKYRILWEGSLCTGQNMNKTHCMTLQNNFHSNAMCYTKCEVMAFTLF